MVTKPVAEILQFQPKARLGDPDFPGIAELAPFQGDGGKARIKRRRQAIGLEHMFHGSSAGGSADLTMGHADPEDNGMPCDVAYCAPDTDLA